MGHGIIAGTWVAKFLTPSDDRPALGRVVDAYDGHITVDTYAPDGRRIGRVLPVYLGVHPTREWVPIEPPNFIMLANTFAYGRHLHRKPHAVIPAPIALLMAAKPGS